MRRIYLKALWGVPCSGSKSLRTESQKDIAEILQSKLATIIEEDAEGLLLTPFHESSHRSNEDHETNSVRKKVKVKCFRSEFSLRELYEVVVTGFSAKGSFAVAGLIRH